MGTEVALNDAAFNYDEMLGKVYSLLQQNNPELADRQVRRGPNPSSGDKSPALVQAATATSGSVSTPRRFPSFPRASSSRSARSSSRRRSCAWARRARRGSTSATAAP